ncbi:hypothetical protein [Ferrimonas gelatinilytica]
MWVAAFPVGAGEQALGRAPREQALLSDEELAFIQCQFQGPGTKPQPHESLTREPKVEGVAPHRSDTSVKSEKGSGLYWAVPEPMVRDAPLLDDEELNFLLASFYDNRGAKTGQPCHDRELGVRTPSHRFPILALAPG